MSEIAPNSIEYIVLTAIPTATTLVLGTLGNIMVITVILHDQKLRTTTNCYLVVVAVSDLLMNLIANLEFLVTLYFANWPADHLPCKFYAASTYMLNAISALSITAFSVERWVAVCHPMRTHVLCTIDRALKVIAGICLCSFSYGAVWFHQMVSIGGSCQIRDLWTNNGLLIFEMIALHIIPLTVSGLMYMQIARRLSRKRGPISSAPGRLLKSANLLRLFRATNDTDNCPSDVDGEVINRVNSFHCHNQRQLQSRRQVIRMLMVVVIAFAILCTPFRILTMLQIHDRRVAHHVWAVFFCRLSLWINSAINPYLYNAMSKKFRRAIKVTLDHKKETITRSNNHFCTSFTVMTCVGQ